MTTYTRMEYEVFGNVQGVCFRYYTQQMARRLGVNGYVENTVHGTVRGVVEGSEVAVEEMKEWLEKKGSPHGRVDSLEINNWEKNCELMYSCFTIE